MRFSDSFRAARWVRTINLLLQAVLFLTLFGGLNYIALNHAWRFDLTATRRHSLSPETESYLERLTEPVRIVVTFPNDADSVEIAQAHRDLKGLMREYVYATRTNSRGKIEVTFLDVYQNRKLAEELGINFPNVVVLLCGDRQRTLFIDDLYTIRNNVSRESFRGESAVTAGILDVTQAQRKKIYFLHGHAEINPDSTHESRGLSQLTDALRARNFELASLELATARRVPDDAALLIAVGPQSPYNRFEEELLRNYLQTRAGRLILMLDPMQRHGLENLLFDWGITVYDNVIYDSDPARFDELGNLRLSRFLPDPDDTRITDTLIANDVAVIVGPTRAVNPDRGRTAEDGLKVKMLVAASQTAWGETNYRRTFAPPVKDAEDLQGDLGVLVVSERVRPVAQLPLSVRGGRLAVFGTSDIATNNRIANLGNFNLVMATINWAVERDTELNIPARPIERFQLGLSRAELTRLRLGLLFIVPGAVALLGIFVYWTRRH